MEAGQESRTRATMLEAITEMEEVRDEIAAGMVQVILEAVPQYEDNPDPRMLEDLTQHVIANVNAFFLCSREERAPTSADLTFVHGAVEARVVQGVPLDIVLHSFRVGQQYLWQWILDWAGQADVGPEVALSLALPAMQYADRASSEFTEAYVRLEQQYQATRNRAGAQVVAAAIAGQRPPERAVSALKDVFPVDSNSTYLVVVVTGQSDELTESIRQGLIMLGRSTPFRSTITHLEERDLVALLAVNADGVNQACDKVGSNIGTLAGRAGARVAVGIGATCRGIADVMAGFAEAHDAAHQAKPGEVVSIPQLSAVNRIALAAAGSGRVERLIPERLRKFVESDASRGGTLTDTVIAYAENDLNARRTSEALFVHANTVLYRLRSINEQTGMDIKKAADLLDLVAAIQILVGTRPSDGTQPPNGSGPTL